MCLYTCIRVWHIIIMLINYFLIDPRAPPAKDARVRSLTLEPKMIYHASPGCN